MFCVLSKVLEEFNINLVIPGLEKEWIIQPSKTINIYLGSAEKHKMNRGFRFCQKSNRS